MLARTRAVGVRPGTLRSGHPGSAPEGVFRSPLRDFAGSRSRFAPDSRLSPFKGLLSVYFQAPIVYPLRAEYGPESAVSAPLSPCLQVVENGWRTRGVPGEIFGFIHSPPPTQIARPNSLGITLKNSTLLPGFSTRFSDKPTTNSEALVFSVPVLSDALHQVFHKFTGPLLRRLVFNSSFKERTVSSP